MIAGFIPCFAQNGTFPNDDVQIGTVWFKGKSPKLSKEAKAVLDTVIQRIQNNPTMQVKTVSFNKDFCDKCSNRSWKRATAVLSYLSKHGVPQNRLVITNKLEGELNKIDLFLTSPISNSIHPVLKKRSK